MAVFGIWLCSLIGHLVPVLKSEKVLGNGSGNVNNKNTVIFGIFYAVVLLDCWHFSILQAN